MLFWNRPTLFESAEKDKRNGGSAREALGGDEKITEMEDLAAGAAYQFQVDDRLEKLKKNHQFDKEANQDLDNHERRGVEAGLDYVQRREAGMPPKNEKDNPNSRYNQKNIEEGLLLREAANGVEYGIYWDKDGELIGINKGNKGSVMCYAPRDEKTGRWLTRESTFTHSHPTDFSDNRELGLSFSKGDISNHGDKERAETRAVAREGTYSIRGSSGFIPKEELDRLRNHKNPATREFAARYMRTTDQYERNRMAAKILSLKFQEATDNLILTRGQGFGHSAQDGRWFSSAKFASLMGVEHKALAEKFGYKYDFKANAGFESMERVIRGGYDKSQSSAELAKVPTRPQMVVERKFPAPTGISPVDTNGDTIGLKPKPIVTARGYRIGAVTDVKATPPPAQAPTTPSAPSTPAPAPAPAPAPVKATKAVKTRVAKPRKPTDIKPPKQPKTPAVKIPITGVGTVTPSTTTLPFSGRGSLRTTGGLTFGSSLSGTGSLFGN